LLHGRRGDSNTGLDEYFFWNHDQYFADIFRRDHMLRHPPHPNPLPPWGEGVKIRLFIAFTLALLMGEGRVRVVWDRGRRPR
jgi:hypothetical protein